ncbi:polymorphic toxin type 50 domain-containing protein [Candidatus Dependentiae bacterium]
MPNQGLVTAGKIPDAPPVDAGKQGKHIPGHNNCNPKKSLWPAGENGIELTQEAWMNGEPTKKITVKTYTKNNLDIKVHIDKQGCIHGYPNYPLKI